MTAINNATKYTLLGLAAAYSGYKLVTLDSDIITSFHSIKPSYFEHKTVWLTGASSGIGEALVHQIAALHVNCTLIISARRRHKLEEIRSKIHGKHEKTVIHICPLDLSQTDNEQYLMHKYQQILSDLNQTKIDILINNAGIWQRQFVWNTKATDMKKILAVNLLSPMLLTKMVLHDNQNAHIVNVSSMASYLNLATYATYSASKSGLNGFTNSVKEEMRYQRSQSNDQCQMCITNILPGAVKGTEVDLKAIGGDGGRFEYLQNAKMDTRRCAELMLTAISNKLSESFMADPLEIFVFYAATYFGPFALPIIRSCSGLKLYFFLLFMASTMSADLQNPLISNEECDAECISVADSILCECKDDVLDLSNSDEFEIDAYHNLADSPAETPPNSLYSRRHSTVSTHLLDFEQPNHHNLDIRINSFTETPTTTLCGPVVVDSLPNDIYNASWQIKMEELLDFDDQIEDKALAQKIKNRSYSVRALQLQQIVECLPSSIALEIISYELSEKSVEIFIRRSLINNVINQFNLKAYISGWILTVIGIYLFLTGLSLFNLVQFVPSEKLVYCMGNYSEMGWRIELSIVLALCTIHFLGVMSNYHSGRKWSGKLKRVKRVLHFSDAENCGEVYIPALKWLGFPFIEAFNVNFKWFFLIGFKYWIMICVFIVLCLPFWVFKEVHSLWLILSIPSCVLCCIGAWLQLVTFADRNNCIAAIKDLVKISIMCLIVFGILYGIIWLVNDHQDSVSVHGRHHHNNNNEQDERDHVTIEHLGSFDILNVMLASIFVVVLICVELKIIKSWKSVNIRYHYFGYQLLASILIVMIFGILELNKLVFVAILMLLYNAAIIWNDLMHKKIMQTTYGLNKVQYVNKYRPIYNTDRDSEWLTSVFTLCCSKDRTIAKCRGRWVINCYAGLVTGTITSPTVLL